MKKLISTNKPLKPNEQPEMHGGSWFSCPFVLRATMRNDLNPTEFRYYNLGFRVVFAPQRKVIENEMQ